MNTPAYFFYESIFKQNIRRVKDALGDSIPLCYSIKANPFLLNCIPDDLAKIEVCSPGELSICEKMQINPERIIYSGVMKEAVDVERAVLLDVSIMTAESPLHLSLENEMCAKHQRRKKVILRLSSGNQFGMSKEVLSELIANQASYEWVDIIGIHYYSGTQKKLRSIEKDLKRLDSLLVSLKEEYDFTPELVEYGPGLSIAYFDEDGDAQDQQALAEGVDAILAFAKKYPVGIEMGRFLASTCGTFLTQVKDVKTTEDTNYVILDGGIHHLKYYGQTMAMKIPPIAHFTEENRKEGILAANHTDVDAADSIPYCLCGSLCTVADVLVREANLPSLSIGDYLLFGKCGAYSVTEGTSLFLSRDLPSIYLVKEDESLILLRQSQPSYTINLADEQADSEVSSWA